MKKRPTPQKTESSALNSVKSSGTHNSRHALVIRALLTEQGRLAALSNLGVAA